MKNQYLNLLKTIWHYAEWRRWKFIITYVFFIVAQITYNLEPLLLWIFINTIQTWWPDVVFNSWLILWWYVILSFVFWWLHWPARIWERETAFYVEVNFVNDIYKKITELPLKWHKDHHSWETIDKLDKSRNALFNFIQDIYVYFQSLVPLIVSMVAVFAIMKWDWLIIVPFWLIVFFMIMKFDKYLIKSQKEMNKWYHKYTASIYDYISNITTVITLRLESLSKNVVVRKLSDIFPIFQSNIRANEWKWCWVSLIMKIAQFVILFYYVWKTFWSWATVMLWTLTMLYWYMNRFISVFFWIAWDYEMLVKSSTDLTAIDSVIKDHKKLYSKKLRLKNIKKWKNIDIDNLQFKYEDEKHKTHNLKDINLNIKKWLKIAFVWESWSWKSTLMTLLRWLSKSDNIDISIDWVKFNDNRILSSFTTLIPQEPEIFENTIEYNITIWVNHKKSDIDKAIQIAWFEKVIKRLPNWIKTNIKEKWVNLSWWEKQRLALARWLFASRNSNIVLLDEPTSSVDSTNELKIYKSIFKEFKDMCVISSIHKLNLLNLFDIIYVFDNWKLIESWDLKILIGNKKFFSKLWKNYKSSLKSK